MTLHMMVGILCVIIAMMLSWNMLKNIRKTRVADELQDMSALPVMHTTAVVLKADQSYHSLTIKDTLEHCFFTYHQGAYVYQTHDMTLTITADQPMVQHHAHYAWLKIALKSSTTHDTPKLYEMLQYLQKTLGGSVSS
jgi:hypothetical protein